MSTSTRFTYKTPISTTSKDTTTRRNNYFKPSGPRNLTSEELIFAQTTMSYLNKQQIMMFTTKLIINRTNRNFTKRIN